MRTRPWHALLPLAAALAAAGCGTATVPPDGVAPSVDADGAASPRGADVADDEVYTATGTVLESPDHGPQLCLGGVAQSYPPQCGGPDISGWTWDAVEAESAFGSTWGMYTVTGTYDGVVFTLTGPPAPPVMPEPPDDDQFSTPCDAPPGGWAVVDPASATDAALHEALGIAAGEEGYAGAWVDEPGAGGYAGRNDPTKLVLNVSTTGDLVLLQERLRQVWGGALCVSAAPRTEAELLRVLDAAMAEPGFLGGHPDVRTGIVHLRVVLDDGVQERMDETYGAGAVTVESALRPVG